MSAVDGAPTHPPPAEQGGGKLPEIDGMYRLKYHRNMEWPKKLLTENTPISTHKRLKLREFCRTEGQSIDQGDSMKSSDMLSINHAQLDVSLQTSGRSSRPITRALSQKQQQLNCQDRAKIIKLDVNTFMGGSCIKTVSEVETSRRCSPTEIIEIDSSDENSGCLSNRDTLMNDFISRTSVKDEMPGTRVNGHGLGSPEIVLNEVQPMETQLDNEEGQDESIASEGENECPTLEQPTLSPENNHGFGSSNKNENDNDRLKETSCTTGMLRGWSNIMQAIVNKHGDIAKSCTFQSELIKTRLLESICNVVQKLRDTPVADMKSDELKELFSILKDVEGLNFDVKWLHQRLHEIQKAMASRDELMKLEEQLMENKVKAEELSKALELKTIEQVKLEFEIAKLDEQITVKNLRDEELNAKINDIKNICPSFVYAADGLL
ncbi:uncharacterized protein [Spinacia oleracea]|uniref:Uncharacterized protein isoform X2 n=1 Tax=Spinacia oleracea TaxID=3562 RepID=A0ABM3QUW4_SPIOL|nr:uncharacterized protein LOC110777961 isoform X2 [Spinacia oleracea]